MSRPRSTTAVTCASPWKRMRIQPLNWCFFWNIQVSDGGSPSTRGEDNRKDENVCAIAEPCGDLYDLVLDMNWPAVVHHCNESSVDAQYQEGDNYETPLYLACQHSPPPWAVRHLMEAFPYAALTTSRRHGDLPLHIACRYNVSLEVLEELLSFNLNGQPEPHSREVRCSVDLSHTARRASKWFKTPIQALWDGRDNTSDCTGTPDFWRKVHLLLQAVALSRRQEQLQLLLRLQPRKQSLGDETKPLLLLHAAVSLGSWGCPSEVLDYMLDRYPEQLRIRDDSGRLPLHIAVGPSTMCWNHIRRHSKAVYTGGSASLSPKVGSSVQTRARAKLRCKPREREVIAKLLRLYPEAVFQLDPNEPTGRYPLHTALINRHEWQQGVKELLERSPFPILSVRDPADFIYPFQLAATIQDSDLDTIYELLRNRPAVLLQRNASLAKTTCRERAGGEIFTSGEECQTMDHESNTMAPLLYSTATTMVVAGSLLLIYCCSTI